MSKLIGYVVEMADGQYIRHGTEVYKGGPLWFSDEPQIFFKDKAERILNNVNNSPVWEKGNMIKPVYVGDNLNSYSNFKSVYSYEVMSETDVKRGVLSGVLKCYSLLRDGEPVENQSVIGEVLDDNFEMYIFWKGTRFASIDALVDYLNN